MDHVVAQGDVIRVMIDAAKAAASYIEALEDVVIRQTKFDGVRAARDHRTQPINSNAAE